MENMFIFHKQQSLKSFEGMLLTHACVKYTANSSSLLTRLGLMQTSTSRTFTAFITLAMTIRCSCASFFNGRASSHFTVHYYARYNTTHERSEKRRSSLKCVMQVQPVYECRLVDMVATLARFAHVNILGSWQLHRLFSRTHEYHSLSCLSICHTNTCQTVKYARLVNLWYSPDAIIFARQLYLPG